MQKVKLRRPFFVVNPKSYTYGKALVQLAAHTNDLAKAYDIDVIFTAQHVDLAAVKAVGSHLIVTSQHMDGHKPGRGMGRILPEALLEAGVQATFLNHAEHPLSTMELVRAIQRADELGILTIVCADSEQEASAIAQLHPDVMVCEPAGLIGSGQVSDEAYMKATNTCVKAISPQTNVLQAAGISSAQNVFDAIHYGADGTGGTSGIVAADDPYAILDEMFEALAEAREEIRRMDTI